MGSIVPAPGVEGRGNTVPRTQPVPGPHSESLHWVAEVNDLMVSNIKCHFFLKLFLLLLILKENALAE